MAGKKVKTNNVKNPLEALGDISSGVRDSVLKDVAKGGAGDFFDQLLNFSLTDSDNSQEKPTAKGGEIELFSASKNKKSSERQNKPERRIEAAIDYHAEIVRSGERASRQELSSMNNRVEEIMVELRKLVASSQVLQMEFAQVSMETTPEAPGIYHQHFFEWILGEIRNARESVEESSNWLNTSKGKNNKKNGYWGMFKKHGTSFAMSNERAVATQAG